MNAKPAGQGAGSSVLVVDDEPQIVRALRINLAARGYRVITAHDGAAALRAVAETKPDVVVLDLGLPDMDGVQVINGLRGWTTVPIIVLSARGDSTDKVQALDAGADDYVTKPFGMDELLARLRATVRRSATSAADDADAVVETSSFTVDLVAKKVIRDGKEVHLTRTEWGVLELLVRNRGRLVAQKQLLHEVWGPSYDTESHYLRVYLAQLRRKLEREPSRPRHLLTEPGMGYRFEP
ncbi:two-component system, OmpR family, KDP operon response regulator KdpE [Amycolatopsis arida]|uniref:Transcriptional regulatory protein KdpE n=1 Tax=Amycolatopsis arida TaxID=587909 RepID=A0A1I5K8N9_9PSEU|nr:response regulator [Amycolatopsis arida]TDX96939.1 two-component system KDP operon response regulator KdpE [Amycolatopsis arida]SFO81442.1 two-component system, OmpR family, KDP operon response regulator KdpE [Amycolatopsis arida]